LREAFPFEEAGRWRYLVFDRDAIFCKLTSAATPIA